MIKCKQATEDSTCGSKICCHYCDDLINCGNNCCHDVQQGAIQNPVVECEDAFEEGTEVAIFETQTASIIKEIADIVTQKKVLEEQEKAMKETLKEAMEQYDVKSFDNEVIKVTYVAPTTSLSIDSAKLKKNYPDIAKECSKTSDKSAYVKITVK